MLTKRSAPKIRGIIKIGARPQARQEYKSLQGESIVLSGQTFQPVDPVSWLHAHGRGFKKNQLKGTAKQEGIIVGTVLAIELAFWAAVFAALEEDCQRCYRCYDYCGQN